MEIVQGALIIVLFVPTPIIAIDVWLGIIIMAIYVINALLAASHVRIQHAFLVTIISFYKMAYASQIIAALTIIPTILIILISLARMVISRILPEIVCLVGIIALCVLMQIIA